jgi:hypothetical protein
VLSLECAMDPFVPSFHSFSSLTSSHVFAYIVDGNMQLL